MKILLKLASILLVAKFTDCVALAQSESDINRDEVKLVEQTIISVDRSAIPVVNVKYDQSVVSIEGSELKDAEIYLLDFSGVIVHHSTHYFGMIPDTYNIDAPSFPGKYYIVIDSPVLYAEGMFEIRK